MADGLRDLVIRVADSGDTPAITALRARWSGGVGDDSGFERSLRDWLNSEGERRTVWLATLTGTPVGMVSLFEYRRMPRPRRLDSRWGYLSNMFVREEYRRRGIGSALLEAVVTAARRRGYARVVLSPSEAAISLYRRAGFVVPDDTAGGDRLLVLPLGN